MVCWYWLSFFSSQMSELVKTNIKFFLLFIIASSGQDQDESLRISIYHPGGVCRCSRDASTIWWNLSLAMRCYPLRLLWRILRLWLLWSLLSLGGCQTKTTGYIGPPHFRSTPKAPASAKGCPNVVRKRWHTIHCSSYQNTGGRKYR